MGRFSVRVGNRTVDEADWRLRKAKNLIKLLALAPDHRLHREQVMDLLWPELDPEAAGNNLRKALHVARRALDPRSEATSRYIQAHQELLRLVSPGELWIDAEVWRGASHEALRSGDIAACLAALELYAGDLLPEDRYEEWAMGHREELREGFLSLLMEVAALYESAGELSSAIECFRRAVAADPLREEAHVGLMRAYAGSGKRHQAIRQFEHLREVLRKELDAEPDLRTLQLHEDIVHGRFPLVALGPPERREASRAEGRPSLPLVGRDTEIEALEELLDALFAGRGGLVMIAGEAGAGKTTVVGEVAERARRRGARVLTGAGHEQEGRLPYGPFVEAFERLAQDWSPALRPLLGDAAPALVRLAPAMGAVLGEEAVRPGSEPVDRARLFAALAGFFARLASAAPLVVVLDDVHDADEESLELLHYLARTGKSSPQLFLATFRPEDVGPGEPLGQILAALRSERPGIRFDLHRLGPQESESLVAALLGGQPVDRSVFAATWEMGAGNPFYTEEAIRSLREAGTLEGSDGRWRLRGPIGSVPGPLAEIVAARLVRLGPGAQQILNAAAVIGMETPFVLLEAATDMPRPDLFDALDECLARRVLEETPLGYRFDHPLHRAAVYEALSDPRRAALHGRVAAALEHAEPGALESEPERLAHHLALSDVPGRAVAYLVAAGDRAAALHANEAAVRHYERAIELASAPRAGAEAAGHIPEVWEKLGDLRALFGETGTAEVDAYRSAIAALEGARWHDGLARLHRKAARASLRLWDAASAASHLDEAQSLLAANPDEAEEGRVSMVRAHGLWQTGRYEEATEAAERSIALAQRHGDVGDLAAGYEVLAIALHFRGSWQEGLHLEIERLGSALDEDVHLAQVVDMHHCLGQQHLYRDRSNQGVEDYARRTVELAARAGARRAEAFAWCLLGESLLLGGRWDEAVRCLNRSVELRQDLGPETVALPWQRLAEIAVCRGESPEEYLRHGRSIASVSPMAIHAWGRLYATEGLDALERSDPAGAVRAVESAAASAARFGECPGCCSMLHPVAAEAYAAAGAADAAQRHAEQVERLADRWESTACRAMAATAWGWVALARSEPEQAASSFLSASKMYASLDQPFWEARGLLQAGRVRAESGGSEEARALLQRAMDTFEGLGASRAYSSTRQELEKANR